MKNDNRLDWVDTSKAIGIIFVVWGHTALINTQIINYIYTFHMPLFFLLSGLLIKDNTMSMPFGDYIKKQANTLLVPFFFFGLLTYLAWVLVLRHHGVDSEYGVHPLKPLFGMFYGTGINYFFQHNVPLWFFCGLFTTKILFYFIYKIKKTFIYIIALIFSCCLGLIFRQFLPMRLPWSIDVALISVIYCAIGYWIKKRELLTKTPFVYLFSVCLFLHLICLYFNGRIDMMTGRYNNIVLFYLGGVSGSLFWISIAQKIPKMKLISLVGQNSLFIFVLHTLAFSFFTAIGVFVLKLPVSFKTQIWGMDLFFTLATVFGLIPVALIIRKYIPWSLGFKKKTIKIV